jgi:hypothetical protein
VRRPVLPAALTAAVLTAAVLTLAGCGGGSSSEPESSGSGTSTATGTSPGSTSAPPREVAGVRLTGQGTHLKLGETARVSWHPNQRTTGVVALRVTGISRLPISAFSAWRLNGETRRSTPYFVHATVRNLGKSDLSQVAVPLYLLDQRQTLLQASTFQARFPRCPSRPLPPKFRRGDKTKVCLVYFAPHHGKLTAISFRPTQDFDAITWMGHVATGGAGQHHHQKKHKKNH